MKKRPKTKRYKKYVPFFKKRKRFKKATRNWDDPRYIKWRQEVFKKDNYKCSVCSSEHNLEAHHLANWARFPHLRFLVRNGKLLCQNCHRKLHSIAGSNTTVRDYINFKAKYGKRET